MSPDQDTSALRPYPVKDVIARAGGAEQLALAINRVTPHNPIGRSAIVLWSRYKHGGVPVARVPAVSAITGISASDLRPDIFRVPEIATHIPAVADA